MNLMLILDDVAVGVVVVFPTPWPASNFGTN
jgi:hypothetical protein